MKDDQTLNAISVLTGLIDALNRCEKSREIDAVCVKLLELLDKL